MKAWNKKLMTLACATCLTVGMGAVACADTVDLGYGQYANTSAGVKAVAIMKVPTDVNVRTAQQNKMIMEANKNVIDSLNLVSESLYKAPAKYNGVLYDGLNVYQLQGEDSLGHHKAYLMNIDISKNYINQSIAYEAELLNTGSDEVKEKLKHSISNIMTEYDKVKSEQAIQKLKANSVSKDQLDSKLLKINEELPKELSKATDEALQQDTKMTAVQKQEVSTVLKRITAPINFGVTHVSYAPVETQYGVAAKGAIRGNIGYDSFVYPASIIGYLVPAEDGLIMQVLFTEDTSYDFWNTELNKLNNTVEYKGANK